jgi:hypothetical protein
MKGLKVIRIPIVFSMVLFVISCNYDAEDVLYGNKICETTSMSYKEDISPIITQNCFACHRNNSTISSLSLEGYDNLLSQVESGSLVGTIKHLSGYSPMPQGLSKMSDCNISKIEAWIAQGALNN